MIISYKNGVVDYSKDYQYENKEAGLVIWGEIREIKKNNEWIQFQSCKDLEYFEDAKTYITNLSGAFFGLIIGSQSKDTFFFSSASEVGRCYFSVNKQEWCLSTAADEPIRNLQNKEINPFEYEYYLVNGFSSGFSTYIQGLYKVLPGEVISFNREFDPDYDARLKNCCLDKVFSDSTETFDSMQTFSEMFDRRIENSLKDKQNIAVLFSGGADSTFLLLKLKELYPEKNIVPICFYSSQVPSANTLSDREKATNMAKYLGYDLMVIDPLQEEDLGYSLIKNNLKMPFDSHISFWHGGSLRQIENKFDCIVTGQNADAIYNFGPTGKLRLKQIIRKRTLKEAGIAEVFKRALFESKNVEALHNGHKLKSYICLKLLEKYYHMPELTSEDITYENFMAGFLAEEKYVPNYKTKTLLKIDGKSEFVAQLKKISSAVCSLPELSERVKLLYMKFIAYIQGSDVRVLTELFDTSDGSKVFFPYTSTASLAAFGHHDLTLRDTINAKQYIYEYLDTKGIDVFEFANEFHSKMLTDMQVWHIINVYLNKYSEISVEEFDRIISSLPAWVNRDFIHKNYHNFIEDKEYDITIIFRFLWSAKMISKVIGE
ncbi:TPA: hypothetical protein IV312_002453 [Enterococcus faecium]|nr:hypothetical protein [Enterococcus faecium]